MPTMPLHPPLQKPRRQGVSQLGVCGELLYLAWGVHHKHAQLMLISNRAIMNLTDLQIIIILKDFFGDFIASNIDVIVNGVVLDEISEPQNVKILL
jgi:hypothetical protein